MPASGLIFVVIVAIWAAYFIQHWVRRREHLATARSVDRFSEAMRVLERRVPLPTTPLTGPTSSYSFALVRPAPPEVVVKRAQPRPFVDEQYPQDASLEGLGGPGGWGADEYDGYDRYDGSDDATTGGGQRSRVRVGNLVIRLAARTNARQLRGVALIAAVVAVLGLVVTSWLGSTPWWTVSIGGALLVLVIASLVAVGARARRTARLRAAVRRRAAETPEPPPVAVPPAEPAPTRRDDLGVDGDLFESDDLGEPDELFEHAQGAPAAGYAAPAGDYAAPAGGDAAPAGRYAAPAAGWAPRAVPPPTYTLKARAQRPVPSPVASTPRPQYASMPVRDLPFDGLALDEELEDLPAAYRVG